MKYILFIILCTLTVLYLTSCSESIFPFQPIHNDQKCTTVPEWIFTPLNVYHPLREIACVSQDNKKIIHVYFGNYYYFSKDEKLERYLNVSLITGGLLKSAGIPMGFFPCPYDNDIFLLYVFGEDKDMKTVCHWYLYDTKNQTFTNITPSKYKETGITESDFKSFSNPVVWLQSSTNGNDYFHNNHGIYHLQSEVYTEKVQENISILAVSSDGKYKWHGYKNIKYGEANYGSYFLNGIKVDIKNEKGMQILNFTKYFSWTEDSKYIAVLRPTDSRIEKTGFNELHIINVEKTLVAGKIVIDKTINLVDNYCTFRAGISAQYLKNDKVLLSWSYNYDDKGIIYEVDLNTGKQTPLIYD